jgi:PPOX class probable F420-dependent enzyme
VDESTMRSRVAEAHVGRLATVTAEGRPHLVPCCFVLNGGAIFSAVDHKPKSTRRLRRLANLRANPNAALLVDHYADDWSTLWWVRADGTARILDGGTDLADAIALLVEKYSQYRDDPPAGPVIAIDVATWRGWP